MKRRELDELARRRAQGGNGGGPTKFTFRLAVPNIRAVRQIAEAVQTDPSIILTSSFNSESRR